MNEWHTIENAPSKLRLLVYGNGPVRFGYLDENNNWRATHHGPFRCKPTHWMFPPEPPHSRDVSAKE